MKFLILLFFVFATDAFSQQTIDKVKIKDLEMTSETASRAAIIDSSKKVKSSSTVSQTELEYMDGVTSSVQTQINSKANDTDVVKLTGNQSVAGAKTFTSKTIASSTANGFIPCPVMTGAQRDAIASPSTGDCVYNTTTLQINVYSGSVWKSAGGGLSNWATATLYSVGDVVVESNKIYMANTAHTSTTFASQIANWTQLANDVSSSTGILPLVNGGSNKAATASAGSVVFSDADSFELTSVGTSGQFLKSTGTGSPSFANGTIFGKSQEGAQVNVEQLEVPNNLLTQTATNTFLSETGNLNALANPGFEHSTATTSWTTTTLTAASESTIIRSGKKSLKLSASASTGNTTQTSIINITQLTGTQGIVSAAVRTSLADVYVCAYVDSVETNCTLVVNDSTWKLVEIPFVFGSTSYGVRIKNTSSVTGDIYVDDAYAGIIPAGRMPEVAQAQIAGSSYFAGTASCTWTRTSTTLGAFTTTAACPGPTIQEQNMGSWQTTDSDLPRQTVNNLPSGKYKVTFTTLAYPGTTSANISFAITDGTTTCEEQGITGYNGAESVTFSCIFNYTSSGNRVFELYARSSTGTSNISNDTGTGYKRSTQVVILYYPPSSKIYSQPCQSDIGCANEFSAKVSSAGVVSDEGLDWINGNCAVTDTSLFTCSFNGSVFAVAPTCVISVISNSTTGDVTAKIDTQATTSAIVGRTVSTNATNDFVKAAHPFNLHCSKASTDYIVKNQITGTFANVMTTPGISKPKTCYYAFGGAAATLASPTVCSTGTCVEVYDSCSSVTPPTFSATGLYTALTFANGTFANNSYVNCMCQTYDASTSNPRECVLYWSTGAVGWSTSSNGGFVTNVLSTGKTGTDTNGYVSIKCEGAAP